MIGKESSVFFKKLILLAFLLTSIELISARKDVMKDIVLGYGRALEVCREETNVTPEVFKGFHHAWQEDYVMVDRNIGCALHCMSEHHELLHAEKHFNHDNVGEYVLGFNDGHVLEDIIVELLSKCEEEFIHIEDLCVRAVHIFNCFKGRVFAEGFGPKFDKEN